MTRRTALFLSCLLWASSALGVEPFVISDIRVEGLQRISEGTIYNYLPLDRGDTLTPSSARSAIRELYRTGFFQDVSLRHEGSILVIDVQVEAIPVFSIGVNLSAERRVKYVCELIQPAARLRLSGREACLLGACQQGFCFDLGGWGVEMGWHW